MYLCACIGDADVAARVALRAQLTGEELVTADFKIVELAICVRAQGPLQALCKDYCIFLCN